MKNATEFAKQFKKFRRTLPSIEVVANEHGVIGEVIYAHLLWNATSKQATVACKKLINAAVDLNDLRMNHIYETVSLIGPNYPQAEERAKRMKAVLNSIYKREHGVHVASLEDAGKRDVREYFDTLDGMTPFVCNRVISICFGVAAIPVDDKTLAVLISNKLVHETSSITDVASWLGRQIKADDVCDVHVCMQAWVEVQPTPKQGKTQEKKPSKKRSPKSTVKKIKTKKKATKKKVSKKPTKKVSKKKVSKKKVTKKKASKKK